MKSVFKLRLGDISDLAVLQQLFIETIEQTCQDDYTPEQIKVWQSSVKDKDRWLDKIEKQHFILAELNGILAGYTSLADGQYIDFMYVHPSHQGSGLASLLLQKVESLAIENGATEIRSDVSYTARPFFEHKGYKVVRENENKKDGETLVNFHVVKPLTSQ